MTKTPITSKQFSINWIDVKKGFLVAVFSPVFTILIDTLKAKSLTFDWANIGFVAVSAALAYVLKNFITPPRIIITEPQVVNSVKDGKSEVKIIEKKAKTPTSKK